MRIKFWIFLLFLLTGCAGTIVKPIANAEMDKKIKGIRFYQPAPFLLVFANGKRQLSSKVIYMPDTNRKMSVRTRAILASNDTNLTFSNGMLTKSIITVKQTEVPVALLDAALKLASAAASAAFNAPDSPQGKVIPGPWLFKIVVEETVTKLVGGSGLTPDGEPITIRVNSTDPEFEDEDES